MSSVLITGATGFIGRALCKRMLIDGWMVRGTVRSKNDLNRLQVGVHPVIINTIGPETDWSDALDSVDVIIHLAARVHVMTETVNEPFAAFRQVNVYGSERLAQMAVKARVKRFVFLSSIGVHGNIAQHPLTESDKPEPIKPYTLSKFEAEIGLSHIAEQSGMELIVIRAPLVYGPENPGNFYRLLKIIDSGVPLPFANINNRRSFIYIENLVDAITTCIANQNSSGQIYLVSDGEDISTPDLISRLASALGKPARLFNIPLTVLKAAGILLGRREIMDRLVESLVLDSSKIRGELNWVPPYTMNSGLGKTAEWFLERAKF